MGALYSNENEKVSFKKEIEEAMRHWSAVIKQMTTSKYGNGKIGHILIIFPFGPQASPSWISDAIRSDVVRMLRELADHIESPEAKIVRPH